ncbi:TIP41-like protein [Ctenocephalides felis]|uniref:TIP41-like protein n=1 Tax=Ctenocephalides felis TaxID=7515 RepID=UPI000E6E3BCA|nr:TIP41-like protein [Ctenocephalides felis]
MQSANEGVPIRTLPKTSEQFTFRDWNINYTQSHILHSMCTSPTKCQDTPEEKCLLCSYNEILEIPHLPDMVFPKNVLALKYKNHGTITFNALDALKRVRDIHNTKIACSEMWLESRKDNPDTLDTKKIKPFDWTFSTDYKGTVSEEITVETTEEEINLDKLKVREEILFYHDLSLFEDELHDNGIASLNVKIRVMPSSFFILLRYFLRIDEVLVKINDTRYFYEVGKDYIIREYTSKENKIEELTVPKYLLIEPNEIAKHLSLQTKICEKLTLPKS